MCSVLAFASCSKDDGSSTLPTNNNNNNNNNNNTVKPTVEIKSSPGMFAIRGAYVAFTISNIATKNGLKSFSVKVERKVKGTNKFSEISSYGFDTTFSNNPKSADIGWGLSIPMAFTSFDSLQFSFKATDKLSSSKTIKYKMVVGTFFNHEIPGPLWPQDTSKATPFKLYHKNSTQDLFNFCLDEMDTRLGVFFGVLDKNGPPTDAIDFADNSPTGSPVNGSWNGGLDGKSKFAIASKDFDYKKASDVSARYELEKNNATSEITGFKEGDYVVISFVNFENKTEYAICEIVDITGNAQPNEGYVAFHVKTMYTK